MINLLPPKYKEELREEEKFRTILILGTIFLAVLISFSLILLSIKIYISGEAEARKILLEQKKLESFPLQELEEKIKLQNLTLSNLNSFYQKKFNETEILEKISPTLSLGIHLTSLNLSTVDRKEGDWLQVSLSGFSPSRQTLLEFKNNLENEEIFKEIYFPPSNWVKPVDIDFSLSFKIQIK